MISLYHLLKCSKKKNGVKFYFFEQIKQTDSQQKNQKIL